VASQQAMYDLVADALQIGAGDRVLEVGCGRGIGAASLLQRDPARVCGIDLMPEQVARAREASSDPRLTFAQGSRPSRSRTARSTGCSPSRRRSTSRT